MKKDELTILCSEYGVPSISSMLLMVGKTFKYENEDYNILSLIFRSSDSYPIASYVVKSQSTLCTETWIPEDVFKLIVNQSIVLHK